MLEFWTSDHPSLSVLFLFFLIAGVNIRKRSRQASVAQKKLDAAIKKQAGEPTTLHPEIDPAVCAGCGSCTTVCPEGDVLQLIDHRAVLISPTKCVGHGECEQACPTGAISLVFGTKTRGMEIPRITGDYETNIAGLYIAGELGGMGLIRNAVKQGQLAAKHALRSLPTGSADTDLLIVGAGPAGLSAALTAIAEKKRYICIDQNTFGGTVANFPRQKVVMTYPADLPVVGKMKFPKNIVSKEELLEYWNSVKLKTGLELRERVRFETLNKVGSLFEVKTSAGILRAKKVVLCMGVRGTPRKLGLANEDFPKVAYSLIDPEQYQNCHVVAVGAGNAAAEAVQMLCKPEYKNEVTLMVRGNALDRCNETNAAKVLELQKQGRLRICYDGSVKAIEAERLQITVAGVDEWIGNQYLFVFAGADMPQQFLMSIGIEIDKKFGTGLKKVI